MPLLAVRLLYCEQVLCTLSSIVYHIYLPQ